MMYMRSRQKISIHISNRDVIICSCYVSSPLRWCRQAVLQEVREIRDWMQARGSDSDEDVLFGTPGPPRGGGTWPRETGGTGDGDEDRLLLSLAEHVLSQSGNPNPSSQEVRVTLPKRFCRYCC